MTDTTVKTPIITTRPCGRCGGSGHYSYCERWGTICFGCGGSGQVPCAPVGQKKIPTTCDSINKAKVGDIVSLQCVLYQVVRFKWIALRTKGWDCYNQSVTMIRLVDGKMMYSKREYFALDMESFLSGGTCTIDRDGVRHPAMTLVHPIPEMIGKVTEEEVPAYDVVEEKNGVAIIKTGEKFTLRMRNEDGILVYIPGFMKEYVRQSGASKALKELSGEQICR